ncbi:hypothetical protein GCM10010833_21910 [Blastomonas aquatica]|uniref:histidine kinase n=2 Tax=Blastomonas aquatica TaxID=1510276 RepID=A0ABQ1JG32_9SPHN|nr:HAMP domain-containing sensor histidine kinase [Blastomonas aquatica]GGB66354.1 hypothetical protein GCM10010833_21910 [Blastomonas aquatica]
MHADEPLLRLHHDLGGTDNGELAVPPLLELVRHSLRLGMRLSRPVTTAAADALIDMWCECSPDANGVTLILTLWHEQPLPQPIEITGPGLPANPLDAEIRLDPLGRILRFDPPKGYPGPDDSDRLLLAPLSAVLRRLTGEPIDDPAQIDDVKVRLIGDERDWTATLRNDATSPGHILTLSQAPPPTDPAAVPLFPPLFDGERLGHLFGSQIGPALRLPIGRIIANAETIGGRLEGPLRADYAGYASDIASAGRHLLALVDDLADLEAVEATGFSAAREPVDLADLSRRAAGLLALKAADRQIRIDKPAEDETLPAIGEFRRVLQVLLNLLGNAINYAPDGSMIWLRLDDGADWASVTVADQGPGLSDEDQQRLFNKWERLGRSGDGGSGLGLYISRRLALAMDGDLAIESAPGQGARFTLILPKG